MDFQDLSFSEQANTIMATLDTLRLEIEHHVESSLRREETLQKCLAQVDQLRDSLKTALEQRAPHAGSARSIGGDARIRKARIWSPRLADPERAADFVMDVAEVSPDVSL